MLIYLQLHIYISTYLPPSSKSSSNLDYPLFAVCCLLVLDDHIYGLVWTFFPLGTGACRLLLYTTYHYLDITLGLARNLELETWWIAVDRRLMFGNGFPNNKKEIHVRWRSSIKPSHEMVTRWVPRSVRGGRWRCRLQPWSRKSKHPPAGWSLFLFLSSAVSCSWPRLSRFLARTIISISVITSLLVQFPGRRCFTRGIVRKRITRNRSSRSPGGIERRSYKCEFEPWQCPVISAACLLFFRT